MEKRINIIIEELKKEVKINVSKVVKNKEELTAISLENEDNLRAVIYIEDFIKNSKENETEKEIAERIKTMLNIANESRPEIPDLTKILNDKEYVFENTYIAFEREVKEPNEDEIRIETPLEKVDGVLRLRINLNGASEEKGTIKLSKSILKTYNIDINELIIMAERNCRKEATLRSMSEVLSGMGVNADMIEDNLCMYVMSNRDNYNGASAIYNTLLLEDLANELGVTELLIIPSSVHEVIVTPNEVNFINEIIIEVNKEQVSIKEQLSDNAYIYDLSGSFEIIE